MKKQSSKNNIFGVKPKIAKDKENKKLLGNQQNLFSKNNRYPKGQNESNKGFK